MSTYGAMQTRIADDLSGRTDLTTQIQEAIQTAIKFYERRRFYFNEATTTFSTVASQEYYGSSDNADIPNIIEIDTLKISVNGSTYLLTPRDFQFIDDISNSTSSLGDPTAYCYYKQNIRLFPIPSAVRTITMAYVKRLTTLSGSSDTNAWMTDGEELIRLRAKRNLFINVIRSPEEAATLEAIEAQALAVIEGETAKRISPGRLRPTIF